MFCLHIQFLFFYWYIYLFIHILKKHLRKKNGSISKLDYLNSHNIIHRDLKPDNILENEDLQPKIADFGLSKTMQNSFSSLMNTPTQDIKGTLYYIAPVIWANATYSNSSDVYAFGIMAFEIMTNDIPYDFQSPVDIMINVSQKNCRPTFKTYIPEAYKILIEQCWAPRPKSPTLISKNFRRSKNQRRLSYG